VAHLFTEMFRGLLHWLGVNEQQEFVAYTLIYAAAFALYAGRRFRHQKVYSLLYLGLGLSILVFLFSEGGRGRAIGACGFGMVTVGLFGWYFVGRRKADG